MLFRSIPLQKLQLCKSFSFFFYYIETFKIVRLFGKVELDSISMSKKKLIPFIHVAEKLNQAHNLDSQSSSI